MPLYEINGVRPLIDPDRVWIAPSADLIGDVRLAAGVSVWFGACIRADNTPIIVGEDSNIQEGAMLHSDPGAPLTVGARCTMGHHAVLHGCTIEDDVLIGIGAIVMNRAVIGAGSIVGAGALVTEDKVFPPASLIVGAPAKAVRTLDAQAAAMLRVSAAHYVEKANANRTGLKRID